MCIVGVMTCGPYKVSTFWQHFNKRVCSRVGLQRILHGKTKWRQHSKCTSGKILTRAGIEYMFTQLLKWSAIKSEKPCVWNSANIGRMFTEFTQLWILSKWCLFNKPWCCHISSIFLTVPRKRLCMESIDNIWIGSK